MMPLKFEPGTSFEYGVGHVVLGAAIEKVCEQTLHDALQDLVFGPVGIHSAQFYELPSLDYSDLTTSHLCQCHLGGVIQKPIWNSVI